MRVPRSVDEAYSSGENTNDKMRKDEIEGKCQRLKIHMQI